MTAPTYLFYDIESTGLSNAFDQVLQFAAIRTDLKFNVQEQHEIMVKLRPDIIPSPRAMISHCLSLEQITHGLCEYEATLQIHALLNEPNTISLGYNTLGFDDEFLRFSFHRNLLPPYTHQYAHNCSRMDLLPMVTLYWLYKHDVLQWPEIEGRISLKLEDLKEANHLADGLSHDALVDVQATVDLARRLAKEPEMWQYLSAHFKKNIDRQRLDKLEPLSEILPKKYKLGLFVRIDYGSEKNYQVPVLFLGYSKAYSNQLIWLRLDRPELQLTDAETISDHTWVVRKKLGEPGIVLPAHERFMSKLDGDRLEILATNRNWLEENPDMLESIAQYHKEYKYPEIPNVDVDAALYQIEFMSEHEGESCGKFHAGDLEKKLSLLNHFHRPALVELSKRVLFRNYPDSLPAGLNKEMKSYMHKVNPVFAEEAMVDYRGKPRLTPKQAIEQIGLLREEVSLREQQRTVLNELETYLRQHFTIV